MFDALGILRILPLFKNIHDVQKGGALQADVHKRTLHAGQYAAHDAQINVAHQAVFAGALNVQFADIVFLQNRHARFLRRDVYQHGFRRARHIFGQRNGFKCHVCVLQNDKNALQRRE